MISWQVSLVEERTTGSIRIFLDWHINHGMRPWKAPGDSI